MGEIVLIAYGQARLDEGRESPQLISLFIGEIVRQHAGHRHVLLEGGGQFGLLHVAAVERIDGHAARAAALQHVADVVIGVGLFRHAADVFVRRSVVAPEHGVEAHRRAVLQVDAAARLVGRVGRDGRGDDVGAAGGGDRCRAVLLVVGRIDSRTVFGGVVLDERSGHDGSCLQVESAALQGLIAAHDAVAHVAPCGHHGPAALVVVAAVAGTCGEGLSAAQRDAVYDGRRGYVVWIVCRPLAERHGVVAVHRLAVSELHYGAEHRRPVQDVAAVGVAAFLPDVLGFVVTAHEGHAERHHVGVALRVVRVAQVVRVIDEAAVVGPVTGHLDDGPAVVCPGHVLTGSVENVLQFLGAGCVRHVLSAAAAVTVLGDVVGGGGDIVAPRVSGGTDVLRVVQLVGSHVHAAVLDAVGEVHVGVGEVGVWYVLCPIVDTP